MATNVYTEKDNGDLKLVAEIEIENPALAVDALLDEVDGRFKDRDFVCLVGDPDGEQIVVRVSVEDDEPVMPRRPMTLRGFGSTPPVKAKRGRKPAAAKVEEPVEEAEPAVEEEEKPAPKPRGRAAAKKPAAKAAAKKSPAKPRGRVAAKAGKKPSPFKRNAASDE